MRQRRLQDKELNCIGITVAIMAVIHTPRFKIENGSEKTFLNFCFQNKNIAPNF